MAIKVNIEKQGCVGWLADTLMLPIMYLLQGTVFESPQRTHRWNKTSIRSVKYPELKHDSDVMVHIDGDHKAGRRWLGPIPIYHMVLFGGWKKFIVVEPRSYGGEWYPGWLANGELVVTKITQKGKVRLGVGTDDAHFFAVNSDGQQIALSMIGEGKIGSAGKYAQVPLL